MGVQRDVLNPLITQRDKIVFHLKKEQRKKAIQELQELSKFIKTNLPEVKRIHDGLYGILIDLKTEADSIIKNLTAREILCDAAQQKFDKEYKKAKSSVDEISNEEKRGWGL